MQLFKWLGTLLLLVVGVAVGFALAARERRRFRQLAGFVTLLRQMRMRIDCFSAPIGEILASLDRRFLEDCEVGRAPGSVADLLASARLLLAREARELLLEMAQTLGGTDKEEQVRCCDYYLAALHPMLDTARRELPKRERTALLFPIFCAIVLVILLL